MKNKYVIGGLVLATTLVLSACKSNMVTNTTSVPANNEVRNDTAVQATAAATITIADSGAEPKSVTIKAGESINWLNKSARQVEVGSADHPAHTKNPQLTGGEFVISLAPGESKVVSAGTNKGTWGWHDHLKASVNGTVVIN